MLCFERLGHGELNPDQAIQQSTQALAETGIFAWALPSALDCG